MIDMAEQVTPYRCAVRKNLRCGADAQKRLLAKLDHLLDKFAEEHDAVTEEALTTAFGTPEEMAKTLMADATPEELEQYRRKNMVKKGILCALLAVFIVFTVWLYFFKEVGLTSYGSVAITDENIESTYSFDGEQTP